MLPAAAERQGLPGSQLAGADGRFQLVRQGGEDLVKLLIAPGLAAVGTLAAPEETHLELCTEHFQELWPGLEPCRSGGGGSTWSGVSSHPSGLTLQDLSLALQEPNQIHWGTWPGSWHRVFLQLSANHDL